VALARVACRAQVGLTAPPVQVEAHLGAGLPCFTLVGLAGTEVKESKERVRAALVNSGFEFPAGRITVNLAPADLPKDGGRFDLAVAVAILVASGQLRPQRDLADHEFLGELGLDGAIRVVRGALPAAAAAARAGRSLILPRGNAPDLRWLPGARALTATSLLALCAELEGRPAPDDDPVPEAGRDPGHDPGRDMGRDMDRAVDLETVTAPLRLADVCGQTLGKRALEVAAAGGHSLLFVGPPGCGKSMLAQRLPALLPPLEPQEALDVALIASIAGVVPDARRRLTAARLPRPFRAPHHTASASAIIGGGSDARPGEITLAHRGVLFLDELPEFDRRVLEALREPLETGQVSVSRAGQRADYPAAFQLIAAMNPCPCGRHGTAAGPGGAPACRCPVSLVERYRARLSGPLLDRIDLRVALGAVGEAELAEHRRRPPCDDAPLRARIVAARERQWQRQGCLNAALSAAGLEERLGVSVGAQRLLASGRGPLALSLRARHRCLRVARSLADLVGSAAVEEAHLAEALALRRGLPTQDDRLLASGPF
jgi:magnesium chelatase family protein